MTSTPDNLFSSTSSSDSKQRSTYSSAHKLYSPQPVKMSSYYSNDTNSSFGSFSPPFASMNPSALCLDYNNNSLFSNTSSPCKKLFSSPESTTPASQLQQQTQPFFLNEITQLREDSMNQLENEINLYSNSMEVTFDADLLLQQLDEEFANFPGSISSSNQN